MAKRRPHDHRAVMVSQAKLRRWKRGAELGLGKGHLFERLLSSCPSLYLIGVDHFARPDRRRLVLEIAARYPDRCEILAEPTTAAALHVPDDSLDFVFIDAGHSYEAVRDDIAAWAPKVRKHGWLGGHDYHPEHVGVRQAVDEAFGEDFSQLEGWIWWRRQS